MNSYPIFSGYLFSWLATNHQHTLVKVMLSLCVTTRNV